jgi:anthranilate synthase component I
MTARLIVRRRIGDVETPVSTFLKLGDAPGAFLFESIAGGERLGRYSFIGLEPERWFRIQNGVAEIAATELICRPWPPVPLATSATT